MPKSTKLIKKNVVTGVKRENLLVAFYSFFKSAFGEDLTL